jgi:hypothetical protein
MFGALLDPNMQAETKVMYSSANESTQLLCKQKYIYVSSRGRERVRE